MRKVLIVIDVPHWAWDRNADNLKKNLPDYDMHKMTIRRFRRSPDKYLDQFDHVHFMGWTLGAPYSGADNVSAGVCSHNYELLKLELAKQQIPKFKKITVNNKILEEKIRKLNPNVFYVANGVDESVFKPLPYPKGGPFTVGWIGQPTVIDSGFSKEESESGKVDIKGQNLILKPLTKIMEEEGVRLKILSRRYKGAVSFEEMPKFYSDVHCQINVAFTEGTPNPMFEAASSARPLISVRSGAIAEFINPKNGFLFDSYFTYEEIPRVLEDFKRSILWLRDRPNEAEEMGKNARKLVEDDWTWKKRARQYTKVFNN